MRRSQTQATLERKNMKAETQLELEQDYLAILCLFPNYFDDYQDPRWFTCPEYRTLLQDLAECREGTKINAAKLKARNTESAKLFGQLLSAAFSQAEYHDLQGELEKSARAREIVEAAEMLSDGKIGIEQFKKRIDSYSDLDLLSDNGLPDDMIGLITSSSSVLKFDKYRHTFGDTLGISENTLTTIAAYTSRGKSALALNLANDLRKSYPVVYFNLEMNKRGFVSRLMSMNTGIHIKKFCGMNPDPGQTELMEKAERSLNDGNFIAVHGSRSAGSVQEVVKQLYGRFGRPVVVFVDHIHYLTGDMKLLERDRISEAMKVLNALAKDGKATVFVLAQLNREGESKAGLRNLQGSSAIEQDSDNVLILEPAEDETDGFGTAKKDLHMYLKAMKVRDGTQARCSLLFRKDRQQFVEEYGSQGRTGKSPERQLWA